MLSEFSTKFILNLVTDEMRGKESSESSYYIEYKGNS